MSFKALLFVALIGWGAVNWWHKRPVQSAAVAGEPLQQIQAGLPAVSVGAYQVQPFAQFEVRARVLSVASYLLGRGSDLAPLDFALGWNRMSDAAVIEQLNISQSGRWYHYRWGNEGPPIPASEIAASSANMHLIPSSASVKRALESVRVGERVEIRGKLVDVTTADGWSWNSSRSRTDTGGGACELVWVDSITVLPPK